jgi:cytochrome b561
MRLYNSTSGYGAIPQAVHWGTVILVAVAWILGLFGDDLPKGEARDAGLFVHISAGLAVLALLMVRIVWRAANPPAHAEPTRLGIWPDRLAQLAHYGLYALLLAVPIAGVVLQFARGNPISLFGIAEIASPWIRDRTFAGNVKDLHEILAHALVILAVFHAGAALTHHWVFHDRTLARMLPRLGE